MSRPTGVLFAIPAGGGMVHARTLESIYSASNTLTQMGICNSLFCYTGSDIEEMRNQAITAWYDELKVSSHFIGVDSDMAFSPELIIDMLRFDKPVTGVLYAKRQKDFAAVGTLFPGHTTKDIVRGFLRADRLGAGVLMIQRPVIDAMLAKFPSVSRKVPDAFKNIGGFKLKRIIRVFDKIDDGVERLSEDLSFCERWKACGGELWVNIEHKISHIGSFDYHLRYRGILEGFEAEERKAKEAKEAA